ncbi:MAG: DUF1329 domain-containing protein [Gammaproteobacteria bacterium]|nr:DUF1329 domain-containing protein [Gammaproteobacteria bacterium]
MFGFSRKFVSRSAGLLAVACASSLMIPVASATLSQEEAAQLGIEGTPLTPSGAIRAGNAEGTIPAWTGGIHPDSKYFGPANYPDGYQEGGRYVDPYADDEILFTITPQNYKQYADKLPAGAIKQFEMFPETFFMNIYPSRRSGAYPDKVYENTLQSAPQTETCPDNPHGRCIQGFAEDGGSVLFPIPKHGNQILWNNLMQHQADNWTAPNHAYITHPGGDYTITTVIERAINPFWWDAEKKTLFEGRERFVGNGGAMLCISQETVYPPRSAGQIFGSCMYTEKPVNHAYIYLPGQRRVRKAPEIGTWDNPATNSDGLRTTDSARGGWVMTGTEERYDLTVLPRKEMFIPYNNYAPQLAGVTFDDLLLDKHLNPELIRYELHRVWGVEGKLKSGERHLIPHRIAYFDEDNWANAYADMWDAEGQMWRHVVNLTMNMYDVPTSGHFWGDAHYDFKAPGRYVGMNAWYGIERHVDVAMPNNDIPDLEVFTPQGLRKYGLR